MTSADLHALKVDMDKDPQLFLWRSAKAPRVEECDIEFLVLVTTDSWLSAQTLVERYGKTDRYWRAVAAASAGRVISGQRGYRRTTAATVAEVDACEAALKSQAQEMLKRAADIRRVRSSRCASAA